MGARRCCDGEGMPAGRPGWGDVRSLDPVVVAPDYSPPTASELAATGVPYVNYRVVETADRVDAEPSRRYRLRLLARRHARNMNSIRQFESYRWEVVDDGGRRGSRRWAVAAFQNVLELSER